MEQNCKNLVEFNNCFYEACSITSRYSDLKKILEAIDGALAVYASGDDSAAIRKDFSQLIATYKSDISIKYIIRWCLRHGFLQQAVTMTAEWFPRYALAAGVFKVVDAKVEEENNEQRQRWDTWTGHLFKNYNPYVTSKDDPNSTDFDLENMTAKALRKLLKNKDYRCWEVYTAIKGYNRKLEVFLTKLLQVSVNYPREQFAYYVSTCKSDDPIKVICNAKYNNPINNDLQRFINKGIKGAKDPANYVLNILGGLATEILVELFDLSDVPKTRSARTDEETMTKIVARKTIFRKMLAEGRIASSNAEKFLEIVEKHLIIVEFYRNRMNHGVIEFNGAEGNKAIAAKVEELLSMAEELENINEQAKGV